MRIKEITTTLKLMVSLIDLHGQNPFKARAYTSTIYKIDNLGQVLSRELLGLQKQGFSKNMAQKIVQIIETKTFTELQELAAQTPTGLIEVLNVKGLGAKKVRQLWQDLAIEDVDSLYAACKSDEILKIKGFASKMRDKIIYQIDFQRSNATKVRYDVAEKYTQFLQKQLESCDFIDKIAFVGQFRRKLEIIEHLECLVQVEKRLELHDFLSQLQGITHDPKHSSPFVWKGIFDTTQLKVSVYFTSQKEFINQLFIHSASIDHLKKIVNPQESATSLLELVRKKTFESEEAIYQSVNLNFIPSELREGTFEFEKAKETPFNLIETKDVKGILHAHSTYSDGKNTLEQMAVQCKKLGYQYLGITDHSKTAFYANGLQEIRIEKQHQEIDLLNKKLAPFKIFKGIESDILNNGDLDYEDSVLEKFDFIIASVHSNLEMDKQKAMLRLVKAIQNPYTSILGHSTGRILLRRAAYPLDMEEIINQCADNQVVIEINASPYRLDLDWRWVHYALEKGVILSINPDAHDVEHYDFVKYGVGIGRKGGLTKKQNLNSLSLNEIETYFTNKKKAILSL